jgi:hypothetical protein
LEGKAMKSLKSFILTGLVLTAMSVAAAAQLYPNESFRVAAAGSCKGWFGTCLSRCSHDKKLTCDRAFCEGKLATCQQSGCFIEGPHFANAQHCGLVK